MPTFKFLPLVAVLAIPGADAVLGAMDAADVNLHGFASQGWLYSHDNRVIDDHSNQGGSFDFNEFAVNVTATPIAQVRVGAQLFASTYGQFGKDRVQLDWGYGEYQVATGSDRFDLSFEAGRIKTSQGLQNDFRDLDMTRPQVFLPMSVYNAGLRDLNVAVNGAGMTTTVRPGNLGAFTLFLYGGGQNIDEQGPLADLLANPALGIGGFDRMSIKNDVGGALTWQTPLDGLRIKGSLKNVNGFEADVAAPLPGGPVDLRMVHYYSGIVGADYQQGDLVVAAEFADAYGSLITDLQGGGEVPGHLRQRGAYGTVAYRFVERWEALAGFNWYCDNGMVHDPVASFTRGAVLALRCDITSHWLVKAEFQRNRGTALLDPKYAPPSGYDEYWNLLALKTTFDF